MGIRQERKLRRKKAEEEVLEAIKGTQEYIAENYPIGKNISLAEIRGYIEARVSIDTSLRYKDIINYYMNKLVNQARKEMERMKGGKLNGSENNVI